jgi:phage/plasmid primase-like uncharacterized protein
VTFEQHQAVKEIAGRLENGQKAIDYDRAKKCWYANPGADLDKLKPWVAPGNVPWQPPVVSPREAFAAAMREQGLVIEGEHPIMDGKKHRVPVEGGKKTDGFYVGHEDGRPNGQFCNNRVDSEHVHKWLYKGYEASATEKAQYQAATAQKLQQREQDRQLAAAATAKAVNELLAVAPLATADHPYLAKKQVPPGELRVVPSDASGLPADTIVRIGKDWREAKQLREDYPAAVVFKAGDLLVSSRNSAGEIVSAQNIQATGTKMHAKGGQKEGCFHVVGGFDALATAPAIVISEGYATAASVSRATGFPTVAAFDAGNLEAVAKALHQAFPDKPVIVAGDDDRQHEIERGMNPGKDKAKAAAKAVDGVVFFPIFAPGEQAGNPKGFTDFNDLATNSELGLDGLERQVQAAVGKAIEKHQARMVHMQKQEQHELKQDRRPRTARIG